MSKEEQVAVARYVKREYDRLVYQQPNSYLFKNAQSDPAAWQTRLRDLIARDEKRVAAIVAAYSRTPEGAQSGFTLIELSVVLVIIGLIVGGVLVGQSLISAAGVRATITQVEKYNTAVNTFRGKYGALPGDMNAASAAQFGFTSRTGTQGYGDGNGVLEDGADNTASFPMGLGQGNGEMELFWIDLTSANGLNVNLIEGSFQTTNVTASNNPQSFSLAFPPAKISGGNYFYVYSYNSTNYYGLSVPTFINMSNQGGFCSLPGLTVAQAFAIDKKVDDGFPQTGSVTASMVAYDMSQTAPGWASGNYLGIAGCGDIYGHGVGPGSAASPTSYSCYDNGGNASNPMQYSVQVSNGSNVNCALSFRFQ